jgi:hypothetical protein
VRLYHAKIPVQSIKWGEHGNVPPHTIDMTAPKKWFNPNESNLKYKVVYDAVVGSSLRAPNDVAGFVCWCPNSYDCYLTKVSMGGGYIIPTSSSSSEEESGDKEKDSDGLIFERE